MRKKRKSSFPHIYLALLIIFMYIPIVVTVFYSFNESKISSIWGGFSLKWYRQLFADRDLLQALFNSVLLAAISCVLAIIIGTFGAYGMYKTTSRWNDIISNLSTLPIMIPEIILGMVFLALFSFMGIPFGMITLVIAHTSFCIPYIFIMVSARLIGMEKSFEEAARDLGASQARAFFDIILPLIVPAILSGTVLAFAMSFDDVVISIFTTGPKVSLLPVKIYTKLKTGVTPEINALATVILIVTLGLIILTEWLNGRKKKNG